MALAVVTRSGLSVVETFETKVVSEVLKISVLVFNGTVVMLTGCVMIESVDEVVK